MWGEGEGTVVSEPVTQLGDGEVNGKQTLTAPLETPESTSNLE